ncbi:glycosyltransferase [Paenibacillus oryzisoli]|uniref:glycosyltransferase n=1 Tax=Paenibacillus oryzisoli TaxID=1850517 RepID=UPI003D2DEA13
MQKLWIDHVVWTRNYIVSAASGSEDQQITLARLLKNQQDIGDAVKPFYGDAAGNKLAELLKEHILLAGKLLDAVKGGHEAEAKKYDKEWHRNADDLAKLLSSANPYWSQKELQSMLYTHLQFVTDAVTARLKKDWPADVTAFDKGEAHIVKFADVLAKGLFQQFPQKFQ